MHTKKTPNLHVQLPLTQAWLFPFALDVDECQMVPDICGEGYICSNYPGTYQCRCAPGFELDSQNNCIGECMKYAGCSKSLPSD